MVHPTPTQVLLTTTLQPLVAQLSGSLAHAVRLLDQFLHNEPTPQKMAEFERELSTLLREVCRRILAWLLNHLEPEDATEAPSEPCCFPPGCRWLRAPMPADDFFPVLPTGAWARCEAWCGYCPLPHTAHDTPIALPASSDVPPGVRAAHAQGGESGTRSGVHPLSRPAQSCASASALPGPDPYRRQTPSPAR
jgi:hypothetical protein